MKKTYTKSRFISFYNCFIMLNIMFYGKIMEKSSIRSSVRSSRKQGQGALGALHTALGGQQGAIGRPLHQATALRAQAVAIGGGIAQGGLQRAVEKAGQAVAAVLARFRSGFEQNRPKLMEIHGFRATRKCFEAMRYDVHPDFHPEKWSQSLESPVFRACVGAKGWP